MRILSPLATLAVSALFLWLAVQPAVPQPLERFSDKLIHLGGYVVLAVLASHSSRVLAVRREHVAAWSYTVGHGGLLEVLQYFFPPRQASFVDLVFDALGATLGVALFTLAARRQR